MIKPSTLILLLLFSSLSFASVCKLDESINIMKCHHQKKYFHLRNELREVFYALPNTPQPEKGYPAVFFFQGSFAPIYFTRSKFEALGGYYEILTIKNLLDQGYAVIAPKASQGGFWQTNLVGLDYSLSNDNIFMKKIFAALQQQKLGPLDPNNLFATGISSGGYMSDRIAQSHPQIKLKALAIASASYASCGGINCPLPKKISADHPPTLFLHGQYDPVVPLITMEKYEDLLAENDVETKIVLDEHAGHHWLSVAPIEVVNWFNLFLE